jgi:hypothetical protein
MALLRSPLGGLGGEIPGRRTAHRSRPSIAPRSAFAGFRFPSDVIVLAVRWYLRFGLSYRDVEELLAERGIEVDYVTVYRWVQRFMRLLAEACGCQKLGRRCWAGSSPEDHRAVMIGA